MSAVAHLGCGECHKAADPCDCPYSVRETIPLRILRALPCPECMATPCLPGCIERQPR